MANKFNRRKRSAKVAKMNVPNKNQKGSSEEKKETKQVDPFGPPFFEGDLFGPMPNEFGPEPRMNRDGKDFEKEFVKYHDEFLEGPQGFGPGPEEFERGPQEFGPGPEEFERGPQGFGPGPEEFERGPQGFGPGPEEPPFRQVQDKPESKNKNKPKKS